MLPTSNPLISKTTRKLHMLTTRCYSANWSRPIAASNQLTHHKSTFQGYVTDIPCDDIPDPQQVPGWMKNEVVPSFLGHVHEVEARTRRASHAMYAWRLRPPSPSGQSSVIQFGSSNGGEAGAGERLERLLEMAGCENVLLVVFRWYGGVKLGSDRWKCISSVAKEALEKGSFMGGSNASEGGSGGAAKKKKRR